MAKARNNPEEQEDQADAPSESSGKTVKMKYVGPAGQSVRGLAGAGTLEPGESYDVPEEMADGLKAGSAFWE